MVGSAVIAQVTQHTDTQTCDTCSKKPHLYTACIRCGLKTVVHDQRYYYIPLWYYKNIYLKLSYVAVPVDKKQFIHLLIIRLLHQFLAQKIRTNPPNVNHEKSDPTRPTHGVTYSRRPYPLRPHPMLPITNEFQPQSERSKEWWTVSRETRPFTSSHLHAVSDSGD